MLLITLKILFYLIYRLHFVIYFYLSQRIFINFFVLKHHNLFMVLFLFLFSQWLYAFDTSISMCMASPNQIVHLNEIENPLDVQTVFREELRQNLFNPIRLPHEHVQIQMHNVLSNPGNVYNMFFRNFQIQQARIDSNYSLQFCSAMDAYFEFIYDMHHAGLVSGYLPGFLSQPARELFLNITPRLQDENGYPTINPDFFINIISNMYSRDMTILAPQNITNVSSLFIRQHLTNVSANIDYLYARLPQDADQFEENNMIYVKNCFKMWRNFISGTSRLIIGYYEPEGWQFANTNRIPSNPNLALLPLSTKIDFFIGEIQTQKTNGLVIYRSMAVILNNNIENITSGTGVSSNIAGSGSSSSSLIEE